IDWSLLELAVEETLPHQYADGDRRVINGRWHTMTAGEWISDPISDSKAIDADLYGATTLEALRARLTSRESMLGLTMEQLENIRMDHPQLVTEDTRLLEAMQFAQTVPDPHKERVLRGCLIGHVVDDLSAVIIQQGNSSDAANSMRADIRVMISDEITKYGAHAAADKKLSKLKNSAWASFLLSADKDGNFSDMLMDGIEVQKAQSFDPADPVSIIKHLQTKQITPTGIGVQELRALCTLYPQAKSNEEFVSLLLNDNPDLATDRYLHINTLDRAVAGKVSTNVANIYEALSSEHLPLAVKNSLHRQLSEIEARRKKTDPQSIRFNMAARWFDRRLVLDFLQAEGYDKFRYIQDESFVEDGVSVAEEYEGRDGVFSGYRYRSVKKKNGTLEYEEQTSADKDEKFEFQLEKYLNGGSVRGANAQASAEYRARIARLDERFASYLRQRDDFAEIAAQYDSAFNDYISAEHSNASLGLEGISGNRVPFHFQNAAVRRLSEDGRGILGFGTGMGKTTTALALEAYNYENGRSKRTAIVVPKAVLENWYHEARDFYSEEAFKKILFVGLDTVTDKDGNVQKVPVLDEDGNQVINKHTQQ
ncbi:MAG: SNF2-related protein, partial [Plesiomonas shigelloides]